MVGKTGQEEKWVTEDKMVRWHHRLDRHEFEQTLGDSEGQGSLVSYCSWGHKESDTTEQLNNEMTTTTFLLSGFPGSSVVKDLPVNAGDVGSIPGSGRSPREGNDNPLQYSCLENPMDRGVWRTTVHEVEKSQAQFSNSTATTTFSLF